MRHRICIIDDVNKWPRPLHLYMWTNNYTRLKLLHNDYVVSSPTGPRPHDFVFILLLCC